MQQSVQHANGSAHGKPVCTQMKSCWVMASPQPCQVQSTKRYSVQQSIPVQRLASQLLRQAQICHCTQHAELCSLRARIRQYHSSGETQYADTHNNICELSSPPLAGTMAERERCRERARARDARLRPSEAARASRFVITRGVVRAGCIGLI